MNKKFIVQRNKRTFTLTEADIESKNIQPLSNKKFHLIENNKSISADLEAIDLNAGIVILTINGRNYKYNILNPVQQMIHDLGMNKKNTNQDSAVKAPMPGIVLSVDVNLNDYVVKGQNLLKLEAMKMENIIKSPKEGKIIKMNIQKSDKVDKNQVLVEIE